MMRLLFPLETNTKRYTEVSTQQIKSSKGLKDFPTNQNNQLQPPSILPQPPHAQPQPPSAKSMYSIPSEVQFQQLNPAAAGQYTTSSTSSFNPNQSKFAQQIPPLQSQHPQMLQQQYPQFVKQNYSSNPQNSLQPNKSQYASQSQNPWELSSKQDQYQVQQARYSQQFASPQYQDQQKQQSNNNPSIQQFQNYYQYPQSQNQSQRTQQGQQGQQGQQQQQNPSNFINNSSNKYQQHYAQQTLNSIPISYSQGIQKQFSYSSSLSAQPSNVQPQLNQDQQIVKNIPQPYPTRSLPAPSLSIEDSNLKNPLPHNQNIVNSKSSSSNINTSQSLPIPYPHSHQDHKRLKNTHQDQTEEKDQQKTSQSFYFLDDQNYKSTQSESTGVQVTRFSKSHQRDSSSDSSLIILESQVQTPPHSRQKEDSVDSKKNQKSSSLIKSIKKTKSSSNKEKTNSKEKEKEKQQLPLLMLEESTKHKPQLKPFQKKKKKILSDKKIIQTQEENEDNGQQQQEVIVIKIKKSLPKLQLKSKNVFGAIVDDSAEESGTAEDHHAISSYGQQSQSSQLHHHSQHYQQKILLQKQPIPTMNLKNSPHSQLAKPSDIRDTPGVKASNSIQQSSDPCRQQIQSENKKDPQTLEQHYKFKIDMSAFITASEGGDKSGASSLARLQDSKMFFYNILGQERKGFAQQINLESKILRLQEENHTKLNPTASAKDQHDQEGKRYHNNIMNSAVETIVIAAEEHFEVEEEEEKMSQINRYFSENKGQVCFRCGKTGHFRSACLAGSRDREYNCHYCLGGHYAGRCEQKVCYRCGTIGHERNQCPMDTSKFPRCNKCTRIGHQIDKCGVLQPSNNHPHGEKLNFTSTGNEEDTGYLLCLSCGKQGHINCSTSPMITDNIYISQSKDNKAQEGHDFLSIAYQIHLTEDGLNQYREQKAEQIQLIKRQFKDLRRKREISFQRQKSPPKLEVSQIFARRQQQLTIGSTQV